MSLPVPQFRLLLVQYPIFWESSRDNLLFLENLIGSNDSDPHLIILPESFNSGFSMNMQSVAEPMDGETLDWMKEMARSRKCALAGSLFIQEEGKYFNRFVLIEPSGKIHTYDKRHLFGFSGESQELCPGNHRTVIDYLGWKIFPQICYDLRFPVWSRNNLDYDLLINVANWPSARQKVWETLLSARAIENLCYVAGVNRTGTDGNLVDYMGESKVIHPKGYELLRLNSEDLIKDVALSYSELIEFREKFNVLKDRDSFMIAY